MAPGDAFAYKNYLRAMIEGDEEDLVDELDAEVIFKYFSGQSKTFPNWRIRRRTRISGDEIDAPEVKFSRHMRCSCEAKKLGVGVKKFILCQ